MKTKDPGKQKEEFDIVDTYEGGETFIYYDRNGDQHVEVKECMIQKQSEQDIQ